MSTSRTVSNLRPFYDAVVIGARPAGASTAMLLARSGLSVLCVDRGAYGSDALSTHALMRGAVLQLHRWGLLESLEATGVPAIRTTSFHYGEEEIRVEIKPRSGVEALYAPRRTALDALLVDAARDAGADVRHQVKLTDLLTSGERVAGAVLRDGNGRVARVRSGIVIGADGLRSDAARLIGARSYLLGRHASAILYQYWSGLEVDGYHWHFRPGVSAGVIPTHGGQTCVFVAAPSARFRSEIARDVAVGYDQLLAEAAPEILPAMARAQRAGGLRGFPGRIGFLRQPWGPGWALVGDAGYFRDPITAHGITDALRDAELLARAVVQGSRRAFADYQARRDELSIELFQATDEIASFSWDLPAVRSHHRVLVEAMSREVKAIGALGDAHPAPSLPRRRPSPAKASHQPLVQRVR